MTKTKYETIISDITHQIEKGQLGVSSKLPSIRSLSQSYKCSKDTVQRALTDLRHRKLIYPIQKSGYYVLEAPEQDNHLPLPASEIDNLAYEDFRICLDETLVGRQSYLFNYYHKQEGLEELLQSVHKLLIASDVYSKLEQLVITTGTQQALYILSQMDFPENKNEILLESPTYHRMNSLVKDQGLPYQTIDRSWSGLDFEKLEELFKNHPIKFFYTIPRLHNPLGMSYTEDEKKKLVELAHRYKVYIVEDDYLADFDKKHPPLHYYDTNHRVIYIKSFSAALFPALRIATVVLPKPLLKRFLNSKQLMDYDTNLILQKALSLYINNGLFKRNVAGLKRRFEENQRQNQAILEKHPFNIPYKLLNNRVILELSNQKQVQMLKQHDLPLNFLEANSLDNTQNLYIQVTGKEDLIKTLDILS